MVTLLQSSGISGSYNPNIPHLQEGYNQFSNHLPSHIQALLCFHFPRVGTVSPWTAHVQLLYCWPLPSRLGIGNAPWVKMGGFCQIKRTHLLFGSFVWFRDLGVHIFAMAIDYWCRQDRDYCTRWCDISPVNFPKMAQFFPEKILKEYRPIGQKWAHNNSNTYPC